MCLVSPGPRCAPHSLKRIARYDAALTKLEEEFASTLEDAHRDNPARTQRALDSRLNKIVSRINKLEGKRAVAQMDYDGTRTGRRELEAKIASLPQGRERKMLAQRVRKGNMLRVWRKNAMERKFDMNYLREYVI